MEVTIDKKSTSPNSTPPAQLSSLLYFCTSQEFLLSLLMNAIMMGLLLAVVTVGYQKTVTDPWVWLPALAIVLDVLYVIVVTVVVRRKNHIHHIY